MPARHLQVVTGLEVHPEFRLAYEIQAQPQRRAGGDARSVVDDLGNTVGRDADRLRETALREAVLRQKLVPQHLTGSDRGKFVFAYRLLL